MDPGPTSSSGTDGPEHLLPRLKPKPQDTPDTSRATTEGSQNTLSPTTGTPTLLPTRGPAGTGSLKAG